MNQADAELARAWAEEGDRAAMKTLYDRHAETVYAFARGMTGSGETALDVVQETFLRAAKGCGSFRGKAKFGTWLLSVARSVVYDFGRSAARRARDADLDPPQRRSPGPKEDLDSRELTETVRRAVMRLPDSERAAVTLCELQELPLAEAANALGWKVSRLKSTLFRARARLKQELSPYMSTS